MITIEALLASMGFKQHQVPAQIPIQATTKAPADYEPCHTPIEALGPAQGTASLSAISWAINRMDIYGQDAVSGTISHKWWDGYQWRPSWNTTEDLGAEAAAAPVAVTWGEGMYQDLKPILRSALLTFVNSHQTVWTSSLVALRAN